MKSSSKHHKNSNKSKQMQIQSVKCAKDENTNTKNCKIRKCMDKKITSRIIVLINKLLMGYVAWIWIKKLFLGCNYGLGKFGYATGGILFK